VVEPKSAVTSGRKIWIIYCFLHTIKKEKSCIHMIRLDEYRKYAKIRICYLNQFCFGKMESLVNGGLRGILISQVDMVGKRVKFTHYIFLGTFELHKGGSTIKGSEK
jgi:hypothetical protein